MLFPKYKKSGEIYDCVHEGLPIEKHLSRLEVHHPDTAKHSRRVALLATSMGESYGLDEKNLIYVCSGALLHDIGKIWIPTSILDKEDDLDPFEKQILYEHSCNGFMMLQSLEYDVVNQIVLGHHGFKDFYDDQGNVRLHKPDKIDPVVLFLTKIVSVADAYDALSHERSYKPALLPDEINPLLNDLFKDDPELVEMVMNMDD